MEQFAVRARAFRAWADGFEASSCTANDVAGALSGLLDTALDIHLDDTSRLRRRIWKPNARWQAIQRKAAVVPFNGYRTRLLPNDDETLETQCAVSYDLADIDEQLTVFERDEHHDEWPRYLAYVHWGYTNLRIRAALDALRSGVPHSNPFERRSIKGRLLRFVTWPRSSETHASEAAEDVHGAPTLCGGRLAFHNHTQQQWSCYPCDTCRRIVDRSARH